MNLKLLSQYHPFSSKINNSSSMKKVHYFSRLRISEETALVCKKNIRISKQALVNLVLIMTAKSSNDN